MVVRRGAGTSDAGKFEAVVALGGPAHFWLRVALRDEPGPDAARYLANTARLETVEPNAVDLRFLRHGRDANLHLLLATASQVPRCLFENTHERSYFAVGVS
jgi:hypothetical protein